MDRDRVARGVVNPVHGLGACAGERFVGLQKHSHNFRPATTSAERQSLISDRRPPAAGLVDQSVCYWTGVGQTAVALVRAVDCVAIFVLQRDCDRRHVVWPRELTIGRFEELQWCARLMERSFRWSAVQVDSRREEGIRFDHAWQGEEQCVRRRSSQPISTTGRLRTVMKA